MINRHDLVSGRNDRDHGPFKDRHRAYAQACQETQVLGSKGITFVEYHGAFFKIIAGPDDILQGGYGAAHLDGLVIQAMAVLDHDNRVRAVRHHAARRYPDGLPGRDAPGGGLAHGHLAGYLKEGRQALRGAEGVFGPYRVTVHGGSGKFRQVLRGNDRLTDDAAQRLRQGNRFLTAGAETLQ